ncbi:hypothetical protein EVAR_94234_1 [Eumeta japonica]|uniref:Uncharacterized protein n=1 Tax=Eumeta variegata TaxID=151549 RepID=A0A4C1UNR3_EUMVA|nr:hypothetical protein EVAR_94234_1 [Eumeta japonica]
MEMQVDETCEPHSFRSPPRRRRSTFFERRVSLAPQHDLEDNDNSMNKKHKCKHQENLTKYCEKLSEEKDNWKKEVKDRRHIYHDIKQEFETKAKSTSKSIISYELMTNEDIAFLKGKPNIVKIAENQEKLYDTVKETRALFRRVTELDNIILNSCEDIVERVTQHILDNSTVDSVD